MWNGWAVGWAGNLLLAVAVTAAVLATLHSGALAVRGLTGTSHAVATATVAVPGMALAISGFDHRLGSWLNLLSTTLPPLIPALAVEAWRRRTGRSPAPVAAVTWIPAALLGTALSQAGLTLGALVGLGATTLAALVHAGLRRGAPGRISSRRDTVRNAQATPR